MKEKPKSKPLHPMVGVGHVHLMVADLEHTIAFYGHVLGLKLIQRYGRQAAFVAARGYSWRPGRDSIDVAVEAADLRRI